jgi:hypothetical protein
MEQDCQGPALQACQEISPVIIWGSTTKNNIVEQGEFHCPRCRRHSGYLHRSVQRYFTLYFIPLFPTGTLAEYVECQRCGATFDPAVRDLSATQIESLLKPWTCYSCKNLNPITETRCLRCQANPAGASANKAPTRRARSCPSTSAKEKEGQRFSVLATAQRFVQMSRVWGHKFLWRSML